MDIGFGIGAGDTDSDGNVDIHFDVDLDADIDVDINHKSDSVGDDNGDRSGGTEALQWKRVFQDFAQAVVSIIGTISSYY